MGKRETLNLDTDLFKLEHQARGNSPAVLNIHPSSRGSFPLKSCNLKSAGSDRSCDLKAASSTLAVGFRRT
ncbi:hypothetical protein QCA50_001496 [Cerrena zonata]|uniref:Uncharacterized protein n=1 Tax=Cerrena zonata TaxID=2478898 RepID=A0AAW0GXC2_9APHY